MRVIYSGNVLVDCNRRWLAEHRDCVARCPRMQFSSCKGCSQMASRALVMGFHEHISPGRLLIGLQGQYALYGRTRPRALGTKVASRRTGVAPSASSENGTTLQDRSESGRDSDDLRILQTHLRSEAEQSYIAYAMSVIVGRALPDVRDGLKPVHRRIIYALHELGMTPNKPYRKCARVVGDVLGKYHPHGDSAVYDALVRLAQDFAMRAPLVAGHGNFGSLDADPPAAMRYTECRLQPATVPIFLDDLPFNTVDFLPNFDGSTEEPSVLPARIPHLLVNGSTGIAVGIATKIPPHNLREVVAGLCALIQDPDISIPNLMRHIPGPDFPTGGEILATEGIREAYETGKGTITVRGRAVIEEDREGRGPSRRGAAARSAIVVTELPYQTNKAKWVESLVQLVDAGTVTGVSDVRDESDRDGVRVVVEVKKGSNPEVVLNGLYKHTELQTRFSCNMVALVGSTPRSLNLKEFLQHFLDFRCSVVERRTRFNVEKAEARKEVVEGLLTALQQLDAVVAAIRAAPDSPSAAAALQADFGLTPVQTDAVLGLPLRRLTGLERGKLEEEQRELASRLQELGEVLASPAALLRLVEAEACDVASRFGDERRSLLRADEDGKLVAEDIIPNRASLLVFSRRGYIKRMPTDLFAARGRGGKGKAGARLRDDDTMEDVMHIRNHDHVLFFTPDGIVRSVKAFHIPEASRTSVGTPITQVLPISKDTSIAAMLPVSEFRDTDFLVLLTRQGTIKKTPLQAFQDIRANGICAIRLVEGDELVWVARCTAQDGALLGSCDGQVLMFRTDNETLRPVARSARGVRAIKLAPGARLVGLAILRGISAAPDEKAVAVAESTQDDNLEEIEEDVVDVPEDDVELDINEGAELAGPIDNVQEFLLLVTLQGAGKKVPMRLFRLQRRGGRGLRSIKLQPNDELAALHVVTAQQDLEGDVLLGTTGGVMTRTALANIPKRKRQAGGVTVLKLGPGDSVQSVALLPADS
eukprot:jgi/Botrbrau1/6731/Bobra.0324s0017.1